MENAPPPRIGSAATTTTAEYVDAQDIWVSPPSTLHSSSRHSSRVVIPPVFPPRRGYHRVVSSMRKVFSRIIRRTHNSARHGGPPTVTSAGDADDGSPFQIIHFRPSRQPLSRSTSTQRPHLSQELESHTGGETSSHAEPSSISTPRGRSRTRRHVASVLGVDSSPSTSVRQPAPVPSASALSADLTALQFPPTRLSSQFATRATTPHAYSSEQFLVFELFGDLAFIDVNNTYQETIRLARRAFPSLQDVHDERVLFYLPCGPGPGDRARVPEDAWVGLMRRIPPSGRVFIEIAPPPPNTRNSQPDQALLSTGDDT
ncbi:unnamed protein product [Peniophora sp. CBMAI 1063]|nr:unnamed protein product [Peniophora sp. CBMAI 1063]